MSEIGSPDQSEINSAEPPQPKETGVYDEEAFKKDAKEHGIRYARIRAKTSMGENSSLPNKMND